MNKILDENLVKKYPKIFRDRRGDMLTTAMCWGFDCDDGWYSIIDRLCKCLQHDTDMDGGPQVVTSQIKEKYATLSFYTHGHSDYQDGMIRFAENISAITCEKCGCPGECKVANGSPYGWLKTLCDECARATDYEDYPSKKEIKEFEKEHERRMNEI
jgi:hypothetical protein